MLRNELNYGLRLLLLLDEDALDVLQFNFLHFHWVLVEVKV